MNLIMCNAADIDIVRDALARSGVNATPTTNNHVDPGYLYLMRPGQITIAEFDRTTGHILKVTTQGQR